MIETIIGLQLICAAVALVLERDRRQLRARIYKMHRLNATSETLISLERDLDLETNIEILITLIPPILLIVLLVWLAG